MFGYSVAQSLIDFLFGATRSSLWLAGQFQDILIQVRARVLAPVLQAMLAICLGMSVMLVVEAVVLAAISLAVKIMKWKPKKRYKWEEIGGGDEETGRLEYPMVLIQIPMHNEKEVSCENPTSDGDSILIIF